MSAPPRDPARDFARALVRFNAHVLGATLAILAAAALFIATIALLVQGGEVVGPMLGQLRHFLPGYSVSLGGAFVGALWAAALGYAAGAIFSRAYGPWLLREATRATGAPAGDGAPGHDVALLSPAPLSLVTGAMLALGLFAATNWLVLRYPAPSPTLALLSHYLPGFTPTFAGSAVGAFWLFLYGYAGAGITAQLYNAVVRLRWKRRERQGT